MLTEGTCSNEHRLLCLHLNVILRQKRKYFAPPMAQERCTNHIHTRRLWDTMATGDFSAKSDLEGWLYICHSKLFGKKKESRWMVLYKDLRLLKLYKDPAKKDKQATSVHLLGAQVDIDLTDPLKINLQSDGKTTKIKANTSEEWLRWLEALKYCTVLQHRNSVDEETVGSEMQCGRDDIEIPQTLSTDPLYMCVCTIDFGTTYSTWAFSFISDFNTDPTKSFVKLWNAGGSSALQSEKCPTAVLIKPDGTNLKAFGYEAENAYAELAKDNNHREYFYFRRFKMILHKALGESLDRDVTIEDINGRTLRAIDVVAMTIKYLLDDMKSELNKQIITRATDENIKWVLTVPAIWTDGAKQFMREAAIQAGIASERLSLALEPEAASILCRHIPMDGTGITGLAVGARYLVLDAGGGTIDVTIHEVEDAGRLKEVHAACGGPWGGTCVDRAFRELLENVLGESVVERLQGDHMDDWVYFWRTFEIKKRDLETLNEVTLRIPLSLSETYQNMTGHDLATGISTGSYQSKIRVERDKMHFTPDLIRDLYKVSIENTIDLLTELRREKPFDTILMVGGFSESILLQNAIKQFFRDCNVIIPSGCSTAIVKGAIIWGHMPHIISQRVLKYTYGTQSSVNIAMNDKNHQNCNRHTREGNLRCSDVFITHVVIGQTIKCGEKMTQIYNPSERNQQNININVFASIEQDPIHVFDKGCKLLGSLSIRLREPAQDPDAVHILVHFSFSGTELIVDAVEKGSDEKVTVTLNCLG